MAEEEKKATEPQIDLSKIQEAVRSSVDAALGEARQSAAQQQEAAAAQARAREAAAKAGDDPVASVLAPHLGPIAAQLNFKSDDAKDAAIFYSSEDKAFTQKYGHLVESKFNECVKNGQPMNRASIAQWIKGSDAYIGERIKQHDAELAAAREAETLKGNRGGLPAGVKEVDVNASDDDLARALEGAQF